jgi:hypothetical protein
MRSTTPPADRVLVDTNVRLAATDVVATMTVHGVLDLVTEDETDFTSFSGLIRVHPLAEA